MRSRRKEGHHRSSRHHCSSHDNDAEFSRSRSRERREKSATLPTDETSKKNEPEKEQETSSAEGKAQEQDLNGDVLSIIGQRLEPERVLAAPVHSSFAVRWMEILKLGLPSDEKNDLIKKYPPPKNCEFLDPPKLNPEIVHTMNDTARLRDKRIADKHTKLVACISGISKTITKMLEKERAEDVPTIENLSDVCRLLADSIHDETAIRRSLIIANVDQSIKETLFLSKTDEFLFGAKLAENIKSAKMIEQSAKDLKVSKNSQQKSSKNFKGPSRQQQYRTTSNGQKKSESTYGNQRSRYHHQYQRSQQSAYKSSRKNQYSRRRY